MHYHLGENNNYKEDVELELCWIKLWIIKVTQSQNVFLLAQSAKTLSWVFFPKKKLFKIVIWHNYGGWSQSEKRSEIKGPLTAVSLTQYVCFKVVNLDRIETGNRLGSSWFSMSRDKFECSLSLDHT